VTTLAGLATLSGAVNGAGTTARFSGPSGLAFASAADGSFTLFIADTDNGLIRLGTPPPIVPVINPPSSTPLTEGTPLSGYFFSASGLPTSFLASGLPPGLSLNTSTGALTGTPLDSGIYTVTLTVTNSLTTVSSSFNLTVNAPAWATWRAVVFNSTQLADASISGAAADPDGDGVSNLFEYLQDRDPLIRDAIPPAAGLDGGYLSLTFDKLRAISLWQITPEYSADLQLWNRGSAYVQSVATVILDARRERVTVRVNPGLGNPTRSFLRLKAEPAP
jgi:hypothetical protein